MARYLEYLRKSRMDTDYEEVSVEETLSRHRQILDKFCKEKRLNVVEVLEEVVSGESLASRPQMMRLLELVNTGMYNGVVCMDIERLSRGSSMESGYIMQVFQTNDTSLSKEISKLQTVEADLIRQQDEGDDRKKTTLQIIPTTQHILENYHRLSIEEKNHLWKLVLKKATVYRSKDDTLTIHIYPNIPK